MIKVFDLENAQRALKLVMELELHRKFLRFGERPKGFETSAAVTFF